MPDADNKPGLDPRDWPWYCAALPAGCALYYGGGAVAERVEADADAEIAVDREITAAANAGAAEAQEREARSRAMATLWALTPVAGALVLVVGGIGGYLWWRRGKREEAALEAEIAAETLAEAVVE